jgi:hypothetical protein
MDDAQNREIGEERESKPLQDRDVALVVHEDLTAGAHQSECAQQ